MTSLFITIVNMSITASYVALAVMLTRLLLKRAPKIFSYILWLAVAVRMVIPNSFTSGFSLLAFVQPQGKSGTNVMEYIPSDVEMLKNPVLDIGINRLVALPSATPGSSVNPMQVIMAVVCLIWITGAAVLLLYSIIMYIKCWVKLRTATLVKDRIYETDQISTPVVFGFLRPIIYIPIGISEQELPFIIEHELTHIRRGDHLIKPFAFLLLIIHWFNPVMWLSYRLMNKDMEMSCDERVVRSMGEGTKGSYATTLLSLAVSRGRLKVAGPLAFGESDVKARIKNIVAYRKPSSQVIAISVLVFAALITGFTANPKPLQQSSFPSQSTGDDSDLIYDLGMLMDNKTLYVGNASKVGGLISALPKPASLVGKGLELQTKTQPYGVRIEYIMDDNNERTALKNSEFDILYKNSIVLLSLIDNVDHITYRITKSISIAERGAVEINLSRAEANQLLGEDVRHFATDEQSVRELIDRVENLSFSNIK